MYQLEHAAQNTCNIQVCLKHAHCANNVYNVGSFTVHYEVKHDTELSAHIELSISKIL